MTVEYMLLFYGILRDLAVDDTFEMKANAIKGLKKKKKGPKIEKEVEPESTDTDEMSTDDEVEAIMEEDNQKQQEVTEPMESNPSQAEENTQEVKG